MTFSQAPSLCEVVREAVSKSKIELKKVSICKNCCVTYTQHVTYGNSAIFEVLST